MMYIILGIILIIFGYIFVKKGDKIRDAFGGFKEGFREGQCKAGYTPAPRAGRGGRCYKGYPGGQTWDAAQATCRREGANLATIANVHENLHVANLQTGTSGGWIGLNDKAREGTWNWVGDGPSSIGTSWERGSNYRNWSGGEPNNAGGEDCTKMLLNNQWNDMPCRSPLPFVCSHVYGFENGTATKAMTPLAGGGAKAEPPPAKAEPPPAKDGVNGNIVTYNGNKYMTLPSKNPICPTTSIHDNANMARLRLAKPRAWCGDPNQDPTHIENTECGKFREIPSGWKIASHNADSLHIAKNYSFHAHLLRTKTSALVTPYYWAALNLNTNDAGVGRAVAAYPNGPGTDVLDGASEATRDQYEIKYDGNKAKSAGCLLLIKQKEGEKIPKIIINDCLRQQELGRKCFECQPGYSLLNEGQKCQLVPIGNCKVQKNEWCQECEVGFEQGKSGNTCEKIPKVPVKNCAKQREWGASCITCNKYYNLNNEKCNPIAIKNCGIQKETICDECDPGYDTLKDKYNCELITIKNCSIQDGPKCKECKLGYRLSEDRRLCIVKPILNCAKRN